jgi:alpha-beta hydrolase superfamily lysophospholipase
MTASPSTRDPELSDDSADSSSAGPSSLRGAIDRFGAVPTIFGTAEARCFGWFHPSKGQPRGTGVILCRPVGYEGNCTYEACAQLADYLARAGFAVMRFDYSGTGDSSGDESDPHRVRAWLDSVKEAISEVRRLGAVAEISLLGIRLGATLAAKAASELGGVDSLVLWAPCATGRAFVRELRFSVVSRADEEGPSSGDLEALGFTYTAETVKDLGALDLLRLSPAPAPRALIISRDDMPGEGPVPAAFRKAGIETTFKELSGFSTMMAEPQEADVPRGTLLAIADWLAAAHASSAAPQRETLPPAALEARPCELQVDRVREIPSFFGRTNNLFGITAEPTQPLPPSDPRSRVAVLMLSVGTNHHIGPNRMYVKLSRRLAANGYRCFRFDLAGIGDSRAPGGFSSTRMYSKSAIGDVQAAMDYLSQLGCDRFILAGLCSGAYMAFQTALADERVVGQILMNPRRLAWRAGDTLQSVMSQSYKSTVFYRRALFDLSTYRRLLRGEVDAKGIANRLRLLAIARARRIGNRFLGRGAHEEDVLLNLRKLCARGTDALFVVAAEDDGLDYLDFHLGSRGRDMRAYRNFRLLFVEGTDHTFSSAASTETVMEEILRHLDRRYFGKTGG